MPRNNDQSNQRLPGAARHDAGGLGSAANTALVGVPLAYATTGSVTVTAIAAAAAVAIAFLAHRRG